MGLNKDAIIIFDVFLNDEYKIKIFEKTLESAKILKLPIMVISNYSVPLFLTDQFDYFIHSKENLLFSDSYDVYDTSFISLDVKTDNHNFRYENHFFLKQKHGLSVMCNISKCTKLAELLGFKKYIRIEWDFIIVEEDLSKIDTLIKDFIKKDGSAYFIYDKYLPSVLYYHFWMVDLKLWNDTFPNFNDELDYKKFLLEKTKKNIFLGAEQILHICFADRIKKEQCIAEVDFKKLFNKSPINCIVNDLNFEPPSSNGVCRGLARIAKNDKLTDELALFSWNRINDIIDTKNYIIKFDDKIIEMSHTVPKGCWKYDILTNFKSTNFPITLNMNNEFVKTYDSAKQINSFLIFK